MFISSDPDICLVFIYSEKGLKHLRKIGKNL